LQYVIASQASQVNCDSLLRRRPCG
jgi:hypothetical protein